MNNFWRFPKRNIIIHRTLITGYITIFKGKDLIFFSNVALHFFHWCMRD